MTEKRYKYLKPKIVALRESNERKRELLRELAKALNIKRPSTSKLLLWAAFLLCLEIVVFCEYMCQITGDTSFLYALAGIPATLVPTILGYYNKSKSENTVGGIVYETAIGNMNTGSSGEAVG